MKFKVGDRVIVKSYHTDWFVDKTGTIVSVDKNYTPAPYIIRFDDVVPEDKRVNGNRIGQSGESDYLIAEVDREHIPSWLFHDKYLKALIVDKLPEGLPFEEYEKLAKIFICSTENESYKPLNQVSNTASGQEEVRE